MEWRDEGVLLAVRRFGEANVIADIFTANHGRYAGVIRGGGSRRLAPILQPGAQLDVAWRARLDEHLGSFAVELQRSRSAVTLSSRLALAGLNAVTGLLSFCLPEREAHSALYRRSVTLLDLLDQPSLWPLAYLRWELALLDDLGFGLDLSACAVTGQTHDLVYVSPKSGRAVSALGAGDWANRLLPLPSVMLRQGDATDAEILEALGTTGFFLAERLAPELGHKPLPEARARLLQRLERALRETDLHS